MTTPLTIVNDLDNMRSHLVELGFITPTVEASIRPDPADGNVYFNIGIDEGYSNRVTFFVHFTEDANATTGWDTFVTRAYERIAEYDTPEAVRRKEFLKRLSDLKVEAQRIGLDDDSDDDSVIFMAALTRMSQRLASNALEHKAA